MTKKALVTGSAGFVGRYFTMYLRSHGYAVHEVDICDPATRTDARFTFMMNHRVSFDLVVHCAAIVGGRKTIDGSPLALASNLALDAGLFQWAQRAKPGRVLYFSSSAVYPTVMQQIDVDMFGNRGGNRLKESDVDPSLSESWVGKPDALYGWAKLTGENLAHRYRQAGGAVSVVRPFSGYGNEQSPDYPFAAFIDRALRREDPFTIWGDGTQTRDFIHIDDIIRVSMNMVDEGIDGPVNLGTGRPTSMLELASLICNTAGYNPALRLLPDEPSGVSYRVAEATLMRSICPPQITLETGVNAALDYRSRNGCSR
jgi:nucleoside-diphosphate-sugar epimerase